MGNSESQLKAIAIAPKVPAFLSVLGSAFIVLHVFYARQGKRSTHHRLLMGMSVCDAIVSLVFFLGTWPMPRGSPFSWGAVGTQGTCNFQGFFAQFGLSVPIYNGSLSFYYLFKIRFGWTARFIEEKAEPILHFVPFLVGIATAIAGLVLQLYNNDSWECYISPLPLDCKESWKNGGETTCIRGDNASLYRWMFYGAELWLAIVLVIINMFLVYRSVLRHEVSSQRFDVTTDVRRFRHSKRVAVQGYWYCGAFLFTWLFPTITRVIQLVNPAGAPFALLLLNALFVPIQGLFNFIVYIHPRWKGIKETIRKKANANSFFRTIMRTSSQGNMSSRNEGAGTGVSGVSSTSENKGDGASAEFRESKQGLFLRSSLFLDKGGSSSSMSTADRDRSGAFSDFNKYAVGQDAQLPRCDEDPGEDEVSESQHHLYNDANGVPGETFQQEPSEELSILREKMKKRSLSRSPSPSRKHEAESEFAPAQETTPTE